MDKRVSFLIAASAFLLSCSQDPAFQHLDEPVIIPECVETAPAEGSDGIALLPSIAFTFSVPMDRASVEGLILFDRGGIDSVAFEAAWPNGTTLLVTPVEPLMKNNPYAIRLGKAARSLEGRSMAADIVLHFTTTALDLEPPAILGTEPGDQAANVQPDQNVIVYFSEAMDRASVGAEGSDGLGGAFSLQSRDGAKMPGQISWAGSNLVFNPLADLVLDSAYSIKVEAGAADAAGNALGSGFSASFFVADRLPPRVLGASPPDRAADVPKTQSVIVYFSEPMDALSGAAAASVSSAGGQAVPLAKTWAGNNLILRPSSDLLPWEGYTVTVGTGAKDANGNYLAQPYSASFTVAGSYIMLRQLPVPGVRALAFNKWHDVYAIDAANNKIKKFESSGTLILEWTVPPGMTAVAVDKNEDVFACNQNGGVYKYDPNGVNYGWFGKDGAAVIGWHPYGGGSSPAAGAEPGALSAPQGIVADAAGRIWISDTGNDRIQEFTPAGAFIAAYSPGLASPAGLDFDAAGDLLIADSGNDRIVRIGSGGALLGSFGGFGSAAGRFDGPRDIAVDSNGFLYVADEGNRRIQRFRGDGSYFTAFGSSAAGDLQFGSVRGLVVDEAGNVFTADSSIGSIKVFMAN
jgi:sugar lactone lactonase YvrE